MPYGVLADTLTFKKLGEIPRSANNSEKLEQKKIPKDIKDWQDLKNLNGPNQKYKSSKNNFTIESGPECPDSCGDASRYKFILKKKNKEIENFENQWLTSIEITPDEKYIIYEKFKIIDTSTWKTLPIEKNLLDSTVYLIPYKYAQKEKILLIKEVPCLADCQDLNNTLWQVQLP